VREAGSSRPGLAGRLTIGPPRRLPQPANDNATPPGLRLRQAAALLMIAALAAAIVALKSG
jgi:hypothetical protein